MSEAKAAAPPRPGTFDSLVRAMSSWRTASVSLLSFSSGLPLGLVWIAIPDWMRSSGIDIRIVGLITLAQAPWSFKLLWSPLMDRYSLPFMGRRRGWIAVAQVALFAVTLMLAGVGDNPDTPWVVIALAFAIAISPQLARAKRNGRAVVSKVVIRVRACRRRRIVPRRPPSRGSPRSTAGAAPRRAIACGRLPAAR